MSSYNDDSNSTSKGKLISYSTIALGFHIYALFWADKDKIEACGIMPMYTFLEHSFWMYVAFYICFIVLATSSLMAALTRNEDGIMGSAACTAFLLVAMLITAYTLIGFAWNHDIKDYTFFHGGYLQTVQHCPQNITVNNQTIPFDNGNNNWVEGVFKFHSAEYMMLLLILALAAFCRGCCAVCNRNTDTSLPY